MSKNNNKKAKRHQTHVHREHRQFKQNKSQVDPPNQILHPSGPSARRTRPHTRRHAEDGRTGGRTDLVRQEQLPGVVELQPQRVIGRRLRGVRQPLVGAGREPRRAPGGDGQAHFGWRGASEAKFVRKRNKTAGTGCEVRERFGKRCSRRREQNNKTFVGSPHSEKKHNQKHIVAFSQKQDNKRSLATTNVLWHS